ncbi:ribonuclease H-like domain-containing protein, partial [Tanacetum coccineum]
KRYVYLSTYQALRNQDNKIKESSRRSVPMEISTFTALVSCAGLGGYDLSDQAEKGPNYTLVAFLSSNSNSEVSNDSICSKSCLKTIESLKTQNDQLLKDLKKSELMVLSYKTGEIAIRELKKKLEIVQKKDGIQLNVDKFEHASKSLNKLIECQIVDNCKKSLGYENYNAVPPPYIGNFMPPTPDLSFTGLDEFVNKSVVENCKAMSSEEEPKVVKKNDDALIIEQWVSVDEGKNLNTAKPKAVVNAVKGNNLNVVKASACWVWKPKHKVLDHVSKDNNVNLQMDLQDQGLIDSGCSRHMTGNMSYLTNYENIDGGYVAFRGNLKGGKITGKVNYGVSNPTEYGVSNSLSNTAYSSQQINTAYPLPLDTAYQSSGTETKIIDFCANFFLPSFGTNPTDCLSLVLAASRWLRKEPTSSIKTWEDLKTNFLNKYCPHGRTAKKMEEINNFQQEPDETLYQAWKCFKELLLKCPQHYLTKMQEIKPIRHLDNHYCEEEGNYGPKFMEAYGASHINNAIPQKEKDPGSFTLPCFINDFCFDNALVDLGASVSVMPLSAYLNLGLGEFAHTMFDSGIGQNRTVNYLKGIAKRTSRNGKFTFPLDIIIMICPRIQSTAKILGRPFLSIARAKIDVYKRKITLRVGEEIIIFKSVKPVSSNIKGLYVTLRERMERDLDI